MRTSEETGPAAARLLRQAARSRSAWIRGGFPVAAPVATIEVARGPGRGRGLGIHAGQLYLVGSSHWADLQVDGLAGRHWLVAGREGGCSLTSLVERAPEKELRDGDIVAAGDVALAIAVSAPTKYPPTRARAERWAEPLREGHWAILDFARSSVFAREGAISLFEGATGERCKCAAPHLAPADSGDGDCVRIASRAPIDVVRRHLQGLLHVALPDGDRAYFRFYDPCVLRRFLPLCSPEELGAVFGPIDDWWVPDEDGALVHWAAEGGDHVRTA